MFAFYLKNAPKLFVSRALFGPSGELVVHTPAIRSWIEVQAWKKNAVYHSIYNYILST